MWHEGWVSEGRYVHQKAWYERLDKWVGTEGQLDAGYHLFWKFVTSNHLPRS
jgi:hypothetical protein